MATITNALAYRMSDRPLLAISKRMVAPADGEYALIRFSKYTFVTDVWVKITTAFTAGGSSLTVGWVGNGETADAAGFMSNDIAKPTALGLKRAVHDTLTDYPGKYFYSASGMLTCTTDDNGGTAGTFWVFANYYVIHP
jgi:hypothetical protein